MPGCVGHLDPQFAVLRFAGTTGGGGTMTTRFPLPDRPYFSANLTAQAFVFDPSIHGLGVGASNGLVMVAA